MPTDDISHWICRELEDPEMRRLVDLEYLTMLIYDKARDCWSGEFPVSEDVARYIAKFIMGSGFERPR